MTEPKLSTRRLALLSGFALLSVLGAASVCSAESPWHRRVAPPTPPYRVTLEDLDGTPLPTFHQDGATFVLGEPSERYNIRVYNPTGERVEAVVTVDGRDAISGSVGDYVAQRGYLIEPWGSLLVEGFRKSLDEVAAFRFTGRSGSYSALRGTPQHVGVIGVAMFPEKLRPPPKPVWRPRPRYVPESDYERHTWNEPRPTDGAGPGAGASANADKAPARPAPATAAPAPAAAQEPSRHSFRDDGAAAAERKADARASGGYDSRSRSASGSGSGDEVRRGGPSNIGTEYGESEGSAVVEVPFERRSPSHPAVVLSVRYDDYDGLAARGIDLSSLGYAYRDPEPEPDPFPYNPRRFAPPPR